MKSIDIDVYIGFFLFVVSGFFYLLASRMIPQPAQFPKLILIVLMAFSCVICASGVRETVACRREGRTVKKYFKGIKEPAIVFTAICVYAFLIEFLGFFSATSLASVFFMLFFGLRSYVRILMVLVGLNVFIYILFVWQLRISLPSGLLM